MTQSLIKSQLYEGDFVAWCEDTVAKLKARNFDALDVDNLIEEIESLAKRDPVGISFAARRELESRLDVLCNHILKRCYVPQPENYWGWKLTIREQRKELKRLLKQSPSLQSDFLDEFDTIYQTALQDAQQDYPIVEFPTNWPFSRDIKAVLSAEFW